MLTKKVGTFSLADLRGALGFWPKAFEPLTLGTSLPAAMKLWPRLCFDSCL